MPSIHRAVVLSMCLGAAGTAFAGPDWIENGDAGSTLDFAQETIGSGAINVIGGNLGGSSYTPDYEDMYLIRVDNPSAFSMQVLGSGFDAQLFLFSVGLTDGAFGLLANDNTPSGPSPYLSPVATDASGAAIVTPGVYAVAVAGAGRMPVSSGGHIFFYASPTEISGPDGPGGTLPHTGWVGDGLTGEYLVALTGTGFYNTPAPSSALPLLTAALAFRRRRRTATAT